MTEQGKGRWAAARVPTADTAMLLALAAAKQASSPTSMAQARMGSPAPAIAGLPPRIALFAAAQRATARGSFDPAAARAIEAGRPE